MLKIKYFIGCLLVASALISCSKSESPDIKGDTMVRFFTNNTSPGNSPQNAINYNVVNIPDVSSSGLVNLSTTIPTAIKFPVFSTKEVWKDVTINAELDNTLIDAYNAANHTNYAPFPAGVLNTNGLNANILEGYTSSYDSITIVPDLTMLKMLTGVSYIAPIKLTTVSNPAVGAISNNSTLQVAYIVATAEQRRIKYLALSTDALGALITPRTSWAVTFNPAPTPTGTGSITDALTTTYSRWSASPGQVDVYLQATKNVTGIRLYTSNSSTYIPTKVDVYLSNDGITYDLIGSPLKANLTYASSYNYILFYKAIPAKYVRLKLAYSTSTSSNNFRITELDVYAN